jgi:hypothetical protein
MHTTEQCLLLAEVGRDMSQDFNFLTFNSETLSFNN